MPSVRDQINDPKTAFAFLRPSCVLLTRAPTVTNVEALSAQLKQVDAAALQQLQEYVLFPLRFVLRVPGPRKEGVVRGVAEAVGHVLENTCVRTWETLRDLLSELCLCLSSPTDPGKPAETSEELKLSVLRCLDALLHAAYGDIILKLFEPAMLPGLGAAVSLLLALAEKDKCRDVQEAALKCLQALTLQCDCTQVVPSAQDRCAVGGAVVPSSQDRCAVGGAVVPSSQDRCAVGGAVASFLPGITVAAARIITGDLRQGHAVTVRAIQLWSRTVGLVMEDAQLQNSPPLSAEVGGASQLTARRTADWTSSAAARLSVLLKKIICCASAHRHWRVRLEMVELEAHLLHRCSRSLEQSVGTILEALLGAVNDEEPRVRHRCEVVLQQVSQRNRSSDQNFTDVLSENLHSLSSSLPRLMRTSDDQRKLFILNVFLGYLKVLGAQICTVLNSAAHLHRISKALMQVLELDVTDVRVVEERSSAVTMETERQDSAHIQRKQFLYFTDEKIFSVLMEICRTLGYHGNIYLLTDHFLDLYQQSSAYRKQAAMVLNEVIRGAAGIAMATEGQVQGQHGSRDDLKMAVASVMEEYTREDNWQLTTVNEETDKDRQLLGPPTLLSISNSDVRNSLHVVPSSSGSSSSSSSTSTVSQLNSNIWQLCIQLEGVACFARALGPDFRPILMTSLYAVLEKAGEEVAPVRRAALDSMWAVSQACGYPTPKELINDNSDYLLNDISLNLQRLRLHPQAPRVLTVMLTHSDRGLLPLVGDVVQDVLTALDLSYDHTAALFCSLLHALIKALVRWFPSSWSSKSAEPRQNSPHSEVFNIHQFLLDLRREKELAEGVGIEEDDLEDPEDPEDHDVPPPVKGEDVEDVDDVGGPDVKAELPPHLSITKAVMERCIHLLSDPSLRLRLQVLDVLELCVCLLSEQEDELLQLVHRCWPALLQRLTADEPLAVLRAFRLLCTLAQTCGDFLRTRVSKDVLPRLSSSLVRQAPVSSKAGPVYTHSLTYKLQLTVLEGLGSLCRRLELGDADLDTVCEACLPYLSCRQPIRLQEASRSVFQQLIQVDPDSFWFTLNELHCPSSYAPPHADLPPVRLNGAGRPRDEYSDNVLKLLTEEFSSVDRPPNDAIDSSVMWTTDGTADSNEAVTKGNLI